jgi:hypothetical protein
MTQEAVPELHLSPGADAEPDNERRLVAVAEQIVRALPEGLTSRVEVVGEGLLANRLRDRLPESDTSGAAARPSVIVDTSGSPERIVGALQRLDDQGMLMLTREAHGCGITVDLYADLHLRSLTIVGFPGWRDIVG